jgi:predicted Zn-dependent protease
MVPLLSGCETVQSIDRGLHSSTEAVTERDRVTGQRTLSVQNRSQQIQQGNQFVEQFMAKAKASGKRLNGDYNPVAHERIRRIFARLHQVSHVRDEQWTPVLVEEKTWNAFTTGGTYFVVNSGLEEDLKDDAELANVIAHEVAHTVANHVFERQSYMQLSALSGSRSTRRETFPAAFTHENEAEADRIAVLYCALAGYDPYAGARIWRRMHQRSGNDALFVHDHPMK